MANAAGILYTSGSKVLLMKRRAEATQGGKWSFPAGKVEDGETDMQAASRESYEETGYTPKSLSPLSADDNFSLFHAESDEFVPQINEEHDEWMWAERDSLPSPLHPGVMSAIESKAMDASAKTIDRNGFMTIDANPISRSGIFEYRGSSLPGAEDPNRMYKVYRPAEELADPECLDSFKHLPIVDDHTMLGPSSDGHTPAEKKGIHGIIGDAVDFRNGVLYANLKIFSESLAKRIKNGKKDLSLGYRCKFVKEPGTFAGVAYDYVQRHLRGNHLALVDQARCDVSVLDHNFAFDSIEITENKGNEMELKDIADKVTAQDSKIEALTKTVDAATAALTKALDSFEDLKKAKKDEDMTAEEKKAEDAKKEKASMDAAESDKKALADATTALDSLKGEVETLKKDGVKTLMGEISKRDALAKALGPHIGTFDASEKTLNEVAEYGVEKLAITCEKGQERAALDGFLAGAKKSAPAKAHVAADSVKNDEISSYLEGKN